ncbi:MAG: InlB B-repeat-containing protein [Bacteroidales bacterium]
MPNLGFEEYDNLNNSSIEPVGWNSFQTADCSGMACQGKAQRLKRSNDKRPGSVGSYSLHIYSNAIVGIVANGNVTTGKINMGSMTAINDANFNSTKRGQAGFNMPFTAIPDSLVIWVKFNPKNRGDEARVCAVLHNNNDTRDPKYNSTEVVAVAAQNFKSKNGWERLSIPFVKTGNTMDARYILVSLTTNKTPGGGSDGDEVYFDDMLFIYTPTLSIRDLNTHSYGVTAIESTPIRIEFRATGIFSPSNTAADNEFRIELSDASGSFANPIVLGKKTTDESATIEGNIPAATPAGTKYKIRIVSTNPALVVEYDKNIEITEMFKVAATASNHRGHVSGNIGIHRAGTQIELRAVANVANSFTHWTEKGQKIEGALANYRFTLNNNRVLEAHFDTNSYQINVEATNGKVIGGGTYTHNESVTLDAQPNTAYKFVKYTDANTNLSTSPKYTFLAKKNMDIVAHFEAQTFPIQLVVNNMAWGNVNGSGIFKYQDSCTLSAIPKNYCTFIAWMRGVDTLSKELVYKFEVTQAESIRALFQEQTYQIKVDVQPIQGGRATGQGIYSATTLRTLTLEAIPNVSWEFSKWIEKGTDPAISATENPYTILDNGRLQRDIHYIAQFRRIGYAVKVAILPQAGGTYTGEESYPHGEQVQLLASPNVGYEFIAWVDANNTADTLSKDPLYTYTSLAARNLQAIFKLKTYPLVLNVAEPFMGEVQGAGVYNHFSEVRVQAVPHKGFEFRAWINSKSGDTLSFTPQYDFTLTQATTLLARFSYIKKQIHLSVNIAEAGSVSGEGTYEHNTIVRIVANSEKGYTFSHWESAGKNLSTRTFLDIQLNQDTNIQAIFTPNKYTITIRTMDANGKVAFVDSVPSMRQEIVLDYGTPISIQAYPSGAGYRFTNWMSQNTLVSTLSAYSFVVEENKTFIANFSNQANEVQVDIFPAQSGIVHNTGNHKRGDPVELEAEANDGYRFQKWTNKAKDSLSNDPLFWFYITQDTLFYAHFEQLNYSFAVSHYPKQAGSISMRTEFENDTQVLYPHGTDIHLSAKSNPAYHFLQWEDDKGTVLSTDINYTLELTSSIHLYAKFDTNRYDLTLNTPDPLIGSVSGEGTYKYQQPVHLLAKARYGYQFAAFYNKQQLLSTDTAYTFLMDKENMHIEALFDTCIFAISPLLANEQLSCGWVEGGDTNLYKTLTYIKAIPAYGYKFSHWADQMGQKISSMDSLSICIDKDSLVYAHFVPLYFNVNVTINDVEMGQTTPDNKYPYLNSVRLIATPAHGYNFIKWTLTNDTTKKISTHPIYEFCIHQDSSFKAIFAKKQYKIDVESNDVLAGVIVGGNNFYAYQDTVYVEAFPNVGYTFAYWEKDGLQVSTQVQYTWLVQDQSRVRAIFMPANFNIRTQIVPEDAGQVQGGGELSYGNQALLVAQANPPYKFKEWRNATQWISNKDSLFLNFNSDTNVYAVFHKDTFSIQTQAEPVYAGRVRKIAPVVSGQEYELSAEAAKGYHFVSWKCKDKFVSDQAQLHILATASLDYTAHFAPNAYTLSLQTTPYELPNNIQSEQNFFYGDTVKLTAFSDTIYTFVNWLIPKDAPLEVDTNLITQKRLHFIIKGNVEMQAVFIKKNFKISASVSPINSGNVENVGFYDYGADAELLAKASEGYMFKQWTSEQGQILTKPSLIVHVTHAQNVIANFEKKMYSVALESYPSDAGVLEGNGSYFYGDTIQIKTNPAEGYEFIEWINEKGKSIGTNASFTVIVQNDIFFTARYQKIVKNEKQILNAAEIKIYPNPTKGDLQIWAPQIDKIELYTLMGHKILTYSFQERAHLNIAYLPEGIYIYKTYSHQKVVHTGKIIKMK